MTFFLVLLGYLLGSIPTGVIIGVLAGIDVRSAGSGNIGATNVARLAGWRRGILTLLGDTAKGMLPVGLGMALGFPLSAIALTGFAAFVGHLFPVYLKFKGGKGVATALGVLLLLAPLATVYLGVIFFLVVWISRRVSLGSMLSALLAPVMAYFLDYAPAVVWLSLALAVLIVIRHRENIQRLLAGAEPKFNSG